MNNGDLVINIYRATIFMWSEETAEINGRDFFRCRLATENEIDLFNNYIEKNIQGFLQNKIHYETF